MIPSEQQLGHAIDRAQSRLSDSFLVGFQSHLRESIQYFGQELGWRHCDVSRERVTPKRPSVTEMDPEMTALIARHNQADLELYEQQKDERLPDILDVARRLT